MESILSNITNWDTVPRKKSYEILKGLDIGHTAALELVRMAYLSGGWNSAYAMARFIRKEKNIEIKFAELHHGLQSKKSPERKGGSRKGPVHVSLL